MLTLQPTEHLIGINVQGDLYDFMALTDAVHRLQALDLTRITTALITLAATSEKFLKYAGKYYGKTEGKRQT